MKVKFAYPKTFEIVIFIDMRICFINMQKSKHSRTGSLNRNDYAVFVRI